MKEAAVNSVGYSREKYIMFSHYYAYRLKYYIIRALPPNLQHVRIVCTNVGLRRI
jgi:hypothetical protein